LVGAGLLLRSFLQVMDVDLGFQPSHAAALQIEFDDKGIPERRGAILQEMLARVGALPGVESAGIADMLPLDRNRSWSLQAKGRNYRPGELQGTLVSIISPGYLDAIGMRLHGGRDFNWHDQSKSEKVVIINQAAARYHFPGMFPGMDPVGRLALVNGQDARVVGVISDARESSMEEAASPQMYLPATQESPEGPQLVVRSRLDQGALQSSVMRVLRSLNPEQPLTEFRPLQQLVDHAVSPRQFFVLLVMSFAGLGLALASLGIYGVISYSVARQKHEIGIRMALGASQSHVQMAVLRRTLGLAMIGIAVGVVASLGAVRLIASLLFGTAPTDLFTFGAAILALALVALVAGYVPARRASRTDPMVALRTS
jgi:predicted permease